jgi:hypothetical protein
MDLSIEVEVRVHRFGEPSHDDDRFGTWEIVRNLEAQGSDLVSEHLVAAQLDVPPSVVILGLKHRKTAHRKAAIAVRGNLRRIDGSLAAASPAALRRAETLR